MNYKSISLSYFIQEKIGKVYSDISILINGIINNKSFNVFKEKSNSIRSSIY